MNIVNSVITNKLLVLPLCFVGGYTVDSVIWKVNKFFVKYLALPIDMMNHQDYDSFTKQHIADHKKLAERYHTELTSICGLSLAIQSLRAIRKEILYRSFLETIVLPRICPEFVDFPFVRTCASSLLFAESALCSANNSNKKFTNEQSNAVFFNTALLGMICSLARKKIGLVGAAFIHVGYNLHSWQYLLNLNLKDITKNINGIDIRNIDFIDFSIVMLREFFFDAFVSTVLICNAFLIYQIIIYIIRPYTRVSHSFSANLNNVSCHFGSSLLERL